jgi:hypothetical protein
MRVLGVRVRDVVRKGIAQRIRHLAADLEGIVYRELLLAPQPVPQRLAFHKRHDVVQQAVRLAGVVDAEDVRVLELGGERDLAEEPLAAKDRGDSTASRPNASTNRFGAT